MIRDVLVTAINKGQLPGALIGIWVLVILLRIPAEQIAPLAFRVIDGLERRSLLGFFLAAIVTIGWFVHARYQRRVITSEVDRLSDGRNERQVAALGHDVKSSAGKRA